MGQIFTASNAKAGGLVALAAIAAMALTASRSKWVQGGAVVGATMVALPFALKFAGK
jgi:hypothetical protein